MQGREFVGRRVWGLGLVRDDRSRRVTLRIRLPTRLPRILWVFQGWTGVRFLNCNDSFLVMVIIHSTPSIVDSLRCSRRDVSWNIFLSN